MRKYLIVGSVADNPFVADIAQHLEQQEDYLDLISLKSFLNKEFCPRFIINENSWDNIGQKLKGKTIIIVSTTMMQFSRDELAMRNCIIARGAKDNGAQRVILLEPDLYYSAQDRGPRPEHGITVFERDSADYKKFDGQPFSARLYAELLKMSGVDEVVTVHNHSHSVKNIFMDRFSGHFHDLLPADIYAGYLREGDIVNHRNLVICAPDKGAVEFSREVHRQMRDPAVRFMKMDKRRLGERKVQIEVARDSDTVLEEIAGKDIVVVDDMVRTGRTVVECCKVLRKANPRRIIFLVTHFYSSREGRVMMNDPVIDEIVTTTTIPQVLNRDVQGRLRHKMVVLRLSRWVSNFLLPVLEDPRDFLPPPLYTEDMSSKNPRWRGKMGPLFSSVS
ncbi:MAG: ribose-phosphate pyrophosphokinase [Spirochaetales bacterium]|nr:ribose-phosphate pyrophosphokinase [Spirochaetales bacterium]